MDVGANIGDWTANVLAVVPDARVLAVEPSPEASQHLSARFADHTNVRIDRRAVSDHRGTATLFLTTHSHNVSLLRPDPAIQARYGGGWGVEGNIEVETTTLTDLFLGEEDVALLKLDVQGSEAAALRGGEAALRRVSCLLIEVTTVSHYQGDATFEVLNAQLNTLGFELVGLSAPYRDHRERILWLDACYAR